MWSGRELGLSRMTSLWVTLWVVMTWEGRKGGPACSEPQVVVPWLDDYDHAYDNSSDFSWEQFQILALPLSSSVMEQVTSSLEPQLPIVKTGLLNDSLSPRALSKWGFLNSLAQCQFLVKTAIGPMMGAMGRPSSPRGDPQDLWNPEQWIPTPSGQVIQFLDPRVRGFEQLQEWQVF